MAIAPALHPYRFSRAEYYAIADSLDPSRRYELLDGTIYAMSPANPPHSARFLRIQDTLEIEPDGSPEPDVAIVRLPLGLLHSNAS
jgi:Uma2 family endonuclease